MYQHYHDEQGNGNCDKAKQDHLHHYSDDFYLHDVPLKYDYSDLLADFTTGKKIRYRNFEKRIKTLQAMTFPDIRQLVITWTYILYNRFMVHKSS